MAARENSGGHCGDDAGQGSPRGRARKLMLPVVFHAGLLNDLGSAVLGSEPYYQGASVLIRPAPFGLPQPVTRS
jgi:hypothetical protein